MDIIDLKLTLATIPPKDYFYRPIGRVEHNKIIEAFEAIEELTNKYGNRILNPKLKSFVDTSLLEQQLVINKLKKDKKLDTPLREALIAGLEEEFLTEGFLSKVADLVKKAKDIAAQAETDVKDKAKEGAEKVADVASSAVSTVGDWMNVAIDEAKKVILTLAKTLGDFGKALVEFLKGFGDVDLKAAWAMFKSKDFVGIAKSTGSWLLKRLTDGIALYQKLFGGIKGFFGDLAKTKPIEAIRGWLEKNVQKTLDDLFQPNTSNSEIKKIIETKYLDAAAETVSKTELKGIQFDPSNSEHMAKAWTQARKDAMNDPTVLRLTLKSDGFAKTATMLTLRTGIGCLLAYAAWETWNAMVFIGDIVYDYNFEQALAAIAGKFDVAGWFLSSDGGFQSLVLLIGGGLGMGSIAPAALIAKISLAAVVTVIVIWSKKNPGVWNSIKDSDFGKKVLITYEESKSKIAKPAQNAADATNVKVDTLVNMHFLKKGTPA